jgi:hypothetical protein
MIPISEAESTALLEKSGPLGQYVPLSFGPGGLALDSEDAGAAWAINTLTEMRAAQRALAADLNRVVETAISTTTHEVLSDALANVAGSPVVASLADDITNRTTTAVFEAMQAAGFTILRKEG